jgi:hypothetical protein
MRLFSSNEKKRGTTRPVLGRPVQLLLNPPTRRNEASDDDDGSANNTVLRTPTNSRQVVNVKRGRTRTKK